MSEQSQNLIFLLKAYPQFSQDNEPSFEEIHKHLSHICKKNFCKSIRDFENHFSNFLVLLPMF